MFFEQSVGSIVIKIEKKDRHYERGFLHNAEAP